jgi:TolA-binding protein
MPTRDEPAAAALAAGTPATSAAATSAAATSAEQPPARQAPAVAAVTAAPVTAHSASEPSAAESPPPPEDPSAALFAEAHKLHFVHKDPARALAAWDAYLRAAPDGRFAPEARYNRALTLLRLGRNKEAREALEPFASGAFGTYRRDDARALLDALDR